MWKTTIFIFAFAAAACATVAEADGTLPAFPGAEGYGAYTTGGRGGRVVHVTNLKANGPGSFNWAVNEVREPRTIVFDVSGVIDCGEAVGFTITPENDHVTIAGETSPGGVAVYNYRFFRVTDDAAQVIIRFLRLRGTRIHTKNDPDGFDAWHASDVILDHCSVAGACDETISASDVRNVTIQWTGHDESRKAEAHADYFDNNGQWHNYGGLYNRAHGVSVHHCLFAHHSKRNPLAKKDSYVEAINNVVYNYSNEQQTWAVEGDGLKVVNCFFKLGPDRRKKPIPARDDVIAIRGCVSIEKDGSPGPSAEDRGELGQINIDTLQSAEAAWESVLRYAGALPHDATSARMVRETRTGTGKQGYDADIEADRAALKARPRPQDTDNDGIPDLWEQQHGLDPRDAGDSVQVSSSGYTNLELYCHELAAQLIAEARVDASNPAFPAVAMITNANN